MNTKQQVKSILEDINDIKNDYIEHIGLVSIILEEDVPWMAQYINKVEDFISLCGSPENQTKETSFMTGYFSALNDLKNTLKYDENKN